MSYRETIHYLESFINYEKNNNYSYKESVKLERIRDFLRLIGNPQDSLRCIHIAGTKGKGSVSAFAASILRAAGYKVGLYTSPHLSDVRERIRILHKKRTRMPERSSPGIKDMDGMIGKQELVDLVGRLQPDINRYNRISKYGPLSFFEVYTSLAFQYFKEEKTDFAVLETGLGGRLDATNVVQPHVCGITAISLDHTQKLGNTTAGIAAEKAGIIKMPLTGRPLTVASAPQDAEVSKVLRDRCRRQRAVFYEIGKDIFCESGYFCPGYQVFSLSGILGDFRDLKIRLLGRHQRVNAALGTSLVVLLSMADDLGIKKGAIKEGLYDTVWPGRFQIVSRSPWIVLDGAHNPASARLLRENLGEYFPGKRIILILGISLDRDIPGICAELVPYAEEVIFSRADNPRAAAPEYIAACARAYAGTRGMNVTRDVETALKLARKKADKDFVIAVAGSLFLVAEARELFSKGVYARTG
ncbi:MAG: bifunctional folylpolyglutamate synthase/dihydrofolate synthase [Candidatus Omnitrophica bacterium]|nr:bifunctional folylpolyglutamate synthase/dihydrofolate synthase [Candidatus Omnitrophota bacterium]